MSKRCVCIVFSKDEMSKGQALLLAKSKINVKSYYLQHSIDKTGVTYSLYASENNLSDDYFIRLADEINCPKYSEDELLDIYGFSEPFLVK